MFHGNAQHTGLSPYPGPTTPVLKWMFHTGGPIRTSAVVGNGRIYVSSEDGNLYALNPQGHLLWTFRAGHSSIEDTPAKRSSAAIGPDGTVYVAGCLRCDHYNRTAPPEGVLYALNPGGGLKWNLTIPNSGEGIDTLTSPTIGPDGTIYVSDVGFQIIAANPDGSLRWDVRTSGEVVGPPAVAPDGTVYVAVDDPTLPIGPCRDYNKCLLALNSDGSVKWSLDFGGFASPAVGSDGSVYLDGFAVNATGSVKWENSAIGSPSIGADGTLYGSSSCCGMNFLSAVHQNGTLEWQFQLPRNIGSSEPCCSYSYLETSALAIGSNGLIIFGTATQNYCSYCSVASSGYDLLYAVNLNGTLAWQFPIGSPIKGSLAGITDPAIGSKGTVYVGSSDGNLYAIN